MEEGIGVARAGRLAHVPVLIGFTVETDGRLLDGAPLSEAVTTVDSSESPGGCCGIGPDHVTALAGV